jgi:hypothetical protein
MLLRSGVIGVSAILCLMLQGCEKVKKPTSDATPPTLVWHVINLNTNAQSDHNLNATINAKRGERYRVTIRGTDPEGVHLVKWDPSTLFWQCITPPGGEQVAQNHQALLGPGEAKTLAPDANGYVLTESALILPDLDFALACQDTWIFNGGTIAFTGEVANYFNGNKNGSLKFDITQ